MKKLILLFLCCLVTSAASGAWLYDWAADPAGTVSALTDLTGETGSDDSRDINKVWYAKSGGYHYFRLDLQDAPVQTAGLFSEETGIQIDLSAGGGSAANTSYIANGLAGIDTILLSHYTVSGGYVANHRHNYLGDASAPPRVDTTMLSAIGGSVDHTENSGTSLQWAIPASQLATSGEFTVYGATQDISDPQTYDITNALVVPEPMTLSILAIGASALIRTKK